MGHLSLPSGKKIAVNMGVDFDAQSLWLGASEKRHYSSECGEGEFSEVELPLYGVLGTSL
jgi:hypothetical protein